MFEIISAAYAEGLVIILLFFTLIWGVSVWLKNAGIVDIFWGVGFVLVNTWYFMHSETTEIRQVIMLILVSVWGLRLSFHIMFRNMGKDEDFRYQEFRRRYGEHRYWWVSFFQVFMLQGVLLWIISAPLWAVQQAGTVSFPGYFDYAGIVIWLVGFVFETVGDQQLRKFKSDPENKGKVLQSGLWKYTRHPNYFGDAAVWWGFGLFSAATGNYLALIGPVLMTWLIIRVSGVSMLERTLIHTKPEYAEYVSGTSAFFPWFPAKKRG